MKRRLTIMIAVCLLAVLTVIACLNLRNNTASVTSARDAKGTVLDSAQENDSGEEKEFVEITSEEHSSGDVQDTSTAEMAQTEAEPTPASDKSAAGKSSGESTENDPGEEKEFIENTSKEQSPIDEQDTGTTETPPSEEAPSPVPDESAAGSDSGESTAVELPIELVPRN